MAAKFEQIKRYVLKKIETGEWLENAPIPSENKLAEQFSVSRMTARRALNELQQENVLSRTQGAGTVVASLKNQGAMFEIRDISSEIKARGHKHTKQVITLTSQPASPDVAIKLGLPEGSLVFHSIVVHSENDTVVQYEERYINPNLAPDYLQLDLTQTTAHEYLSEVAPLTAATHSIEAIAANSDLANLLELQPNEPCLQLLRTTSSKQGVVAYSKLIYPGARYQLTGHLEFAEN